MYKLYWCERTGAFAPAAVLEELDCPHEGIYVDADSLKSVAFRTQNPMAQIPLLVLPDGSSISESGAIALYLAETKPESGLAPIADDPIRPHFLRWLSFAQVNLYESVLRYYYSERYTSEHGGAPGVKQAAHERLDRLWDMTAEAIQGPFFFGKRFTILDIYLAMLAAWHVDPATLRARQPKVHGLVGATVARPSTGGVWQRYNMHERMN